MVAGNHHHSPNYHLAWINQPDMKEAPAKRQLKPGLQGLGAWVEGDYLHAAIVLPGLLDAPILEATCTAQAPRALKQPHKVFLNKVFLNKVFLRPQAT